MAYLGSIQAEKTKIDQIVSEFFAKTLHIILESRIPHLFAPSQGYGNVEDTVLLMGSPSQVRATNKWFNLETESSSHLQECAEPWRRGICQEPMVVDILLQQPTGAVDAPSSVGDNSDRQRIFKENSSGAFSNDGNEGESFSSTPISKTLLERWVVQYERRKKPGSSGAFGFGAGFSKQGFVEGGMSADEEIASLGRQQGGPPVFPHTHVVERPVVYKRTVIMLRSLYCSVRTLPAHRLFRLAKSSSHSRSFSLSYIVSSSPTPMFEQDESAMISLCLTPIETIWGRLLISVAYRNATAVTALEVTPPILPRIIADYVGSPTTDPLRRFSIVGSVPAGGISGRRGVHVVSLPGSVPSSPSAGFGRRHSWSGGVNKVQSQPPIPPNSPSYLSHSPSPSQPSPDFQNSPPKSPLSFHHPSPPLGGHGHLPSNLSPQNSPLHRQFSQPILYQPHNASQPIPIHTRRSPPFSPSASPSPPQHLYTQQDSRLRSSSAPVSIPWPTNTNRPSASPGITPEVHHQNRNPLPPPSRQRPLQMLPRAVSFNSRLCPGSGTGQAPNSSLDSKIAARLSISTLAESSLLMSPPHPFHSHQVLGDGKGDDGPPSGVKRSLYGPPGLTVGNFRAASRAGSRWHEDAHDEEFACPFAVDDDEAEDFCSRIESPGARPKVRDSFDSLGGTPGSHLRFQDAAVGALVRILKSAPPLRQLSAPTEIFCDLPLSRMALGTTPGTTATGKLKSSPPTPTSLGLQNLPRSGELCSLTSFGAGIGSGSPYGIPGGMDTPPSIGVRQAGLKTAGDALEELKGYREFRDFLVRQSGGNLEQGQAAVKPV